MGVVLFVLLLNAFSVLSIYQPTGDDVLPGSVLLPATRRGRYLANIVRRQAVDGTGIKFNKDADRMNAESKKKVDVLSDELLPYIIAEQERRTTLYKRVMTAVQNGEKGVTVAEIRNKPPLIIRRGQLYRCPANRAPKEPDGSGTLMCDGDIEPTVITYDSCLSSEDRELYVARDMYFFCNRHKLEGPDLPRNGSAVVGCSPAERTSLNYTYRKCALEDSEDVVVHYRYYPDRAYKFVNELDPEREVCEHWSPCQLGYIYSLPAPDQAIPASELWHEYEEKDNEFEASEIVPPIPEDNVLENVPQTAANYSISARRVDVPEGYVYHQVVRSHPVTGNKSPVKRALVKLDPNSTTVTVKLNLPGWSKDKEKFLGDYYLELRKSTRQSERKKYVKFLTLADSAAVLTPRSQVVLQGQKGGTVTIPFRATRTTLLSVLVRAVEGRVYNVDNTKYTYVDYTDVYGRSNQSITIDLHATKPQDFGDYFLVVQNSDGVEERIKILELLRPEKDANNEVVLTRLTRSIAVGEHFDNTLHYECDECSVADVLCNGRSVLSAGRVTVVPASNMISFNFPSFEDENACVYMGFFKHKDSIFEKILAVIDNKSPEVTVTSQSVESPTIGAEFQEEIPYTCANCRVANIYVNGVELDNELSVKTSKDGVLDPYYEVKVSPTAVMVTMNEFTEAYQGVYQVIFRQGGEKITKTLMEITASGNKEEPVTPTEGEEPTPAAEATDDEHPTSTAEPAVTSKDTPEAQDTQKPTDSESEAVTTKSETGVATEVQNAADSGAIASTAETTSEVTTVESPADSLTPQPDGEGKVAPAEESTAAGELPNSTAAAPAPEKAASDGGGFEVSNRRSHGKEAAGRQVSKSQKNG